MNNTKWINLDNKVVVVTGGSSGIGEQIIEDLMLCGASVANFDTTEPNKKYSEDSYEFYRVDITKKKDVENAVSKVIDKYNKIDTLVNNAGITRPRILVDYFEKHPEYEINDVDLNAMFDINVKGTLIVSQAVTREFLKQSEGNIINMSSAAGLNGSKGHSVYAATKAAINSFTLSWTKELAPYNIRVNSVAPDILERTPANNDEKYKAQAYGRGMDINTPAEKFFEGYKSSIPLGRPGYLYEVSNLVNYLASDYSSYITGSIIPVAGGKTRV